MKHLLIYLLVASMGIASTSCKKDTVSATPTKTELLTNKNWIATAVTVSPALPIGGTLITDYYSQLPSCSKDDFIRFETPSTYKEDEGAVKCNNADPQTVIGTWTFNGDQSVVTTSTATGGTQSYNIVEITDSSLKYSVAVVSNGVTYTLTVSNRKG